MKALFVLLTLLGAGLAGCTSPAVTAPDAWSFVDIEGATHTKESVKGDPAILFFMASWCTSCRANAPRIANVYADFKDQGLQAYSLSWGIADDEQSLRKWQSDYKQPWPHALDPAGEMARLFNVKQQSTVIVLDKQGEVHKAYGYPGVDESVLRKAVQDALAA
jgi:peroxiredoxin